MYLSFSLLNKIQFELSTKVVVPHDSLERRYHFIVEIRIGC